MSDDGWVRTVPEDPDPAGRERARRVAASLMRLALPLLDRAGESAAAARLQHAIDDTERAPTIGLPSFLPPEG